MASLVAAAARTLFVSPVASAAASVRLLFSCRWRRRRWSLFGACLHWLGSGGLVRGGLAFVGWRLCTVISVLAVVVASSFVVAIRVEEVTLRVHKAPILVDVEALVVVDAACWVPFFVLTALVAGPIRIVRVGVVLGRVVA